MRPRWWLPIAFMLALVAVVAASCGGPAETPAPTPSPAAADGVPAAGLVESVSPADGASGVAPDANVVIQFASPVWTPQPGSTPDGQDVQVRESYELIDRFKIVNSSTGETRHGTATIGNNTTLTYTLPEGASWEPHTTYWIMATSMDSLEEAFHEGSSESLFLSAFTTEDLTRDRYPVQHSFDGTSPQLLNDVAFDVDTSSSLSFDELEARIESAQSSADSANAQNDADSPAFSAFREEDCVVDEETGTIVCSRDDADTYVVEPVSSPGEFASKFHFWPNVINLTEVYYAEGNHTLFDSILDQLLEKEPDRVQLQSDVTAEIARGDRVFTACDFVSTVRYGFRAYGEVYYGMIINLDNPDQDGVRRPYVREILVHDYGADGLPMLHDPHTEELAAIFSDPDATPLGASWDLCLRGNLKRTKYNAVVVDKLAEAPDAEFYIERVHLRCGKVGVPPTGPDQSIPTVPWKPWNPVPQPMADLIPNPNLPNNPNAPPNPVPGPDGPFIHPWPFPAGEETFFPPEDTLGLPGDSSGEEPGPGEEEGQTEACEEPVPDCDDVSAVRSRLEEIASELEAAVQSRKEDRETFDKFDYGWPGEGEDIQFNDPCLQKLYEQYRSEVEPLLERIRELGNRTSDIYRQVREKRDSIDPVLQALAYRSSLWANMLYVGGAWSQISEGCPGPFIPAGGYTFEGSSVKDALIVIDGEQQREFQRLVATGLMNGKTWEEAVEAAVMDDSSYPPEVRKRDSVYAMIWRHYADCLKRLHAKQLKVFLRSVFGEAPTAAQLKQMIAVMFGGASALTSEQQAEYDRIGDELDALRSDADEATDEIRRLRDQIEQIRREFRGRALECCFSASLEKIRRLRSLKWILEAYLEWCEDPESAEAYPRYTDLRRFCSVLWEAKEDPELAGFSGLLSYIEMLIRCNCAGFERDDLAVTIDPDCGDLLADTQQQPSATAPPYTGGGGGGGTTDPDTQPGDDGDTGPINTVNDTVINIVTE